MPKHCWLPRTCFTSSSRPLLYAAAAEDAGGELARTDHPDEALDQLNAAFDTYHGATKRSPMRAGSVARCADWAWNAASSARGQKRAGTASPIPSSRWSI